MRHTCECARSKPRFAERGWSAGSGSALRPRRRSLLLTRKEQRRDLARPDDAADFPEREEWQKGDDQHDHPGEDFVHTKIAEMTEDARPVLFVDESFDNVFQDAEQRHKETEQR